MPERNPQVLSYSHLVDYPRADEALHVLKKTASLVKPIMRARGWTVRLLAEFYPMEQNLLGLNVGQGQKICLRLRYSGDSNQFLPFENVVDTMLHELAHIEQGPHDEKFHALWDQLRDEHESLIRKGYTGEGFLSEGHRLGGKRIPIEEARRRARASAEKRRNTNISRTLGGRAPPSGQNIRGVIAYAAERRRRQVQGCASSSHNQDEIREIAETATRNGFKTQAEEDAANETAIAQAYWELVQEEQKAKYGYSYVPPTAENTVGNGGGTVKPGSARREKEPTKLQTHRTDVDGEKRSGSNSAVVTWACEVCTLENPPDYLCCDVCGSERSEKVTKELSGRSLKRQKVVDLTKSDSNTTRTTTTSTRSSSTAAAPLVPEATRPAPQTWTCSLCGRVREKIWWSCDICGNIKDKS